MERLYNPVLMSEAEIKQTFVARQQLLDELLETIQKQPKGAGVQHVVIVAPRGMGKTTILLMVQFALKDRGLDNQWQAVQFPEESYAVNDLADFWIETLRNLSAATGELYLEEQAAELPRKYKKNADLQEAALAVLRDWSRRNGKRLVLLVDNFDQILEQIRAERDNAALRKELMNEDTFMLMGGATAFFHEANAYDQPLYNFFRVYHLEDLTFAQIQDLLRQRASADGIADFEKNLQANRVRLRVLHYFTGGNPRLVLMLYRVVTQSHWNEVRVGLEKLLDEVTPYYKAKIESLPAQQRKILDHIARISSQTNEGLTPGEIAEATRLSPQATSSQLKRLAELGYVRAANLRGRNSYYTLSEPLYAIWHQMRFGRGARRRVQWLVDFLKSWYDAEEMGSESQRLAALFQSLLSEGETDRALSTLEFRRYLGHAMSDMVLKANTFDAVVCDHLKLGDLGALREALPDIELDNLSKETLGSLLEEDCITQEVYEKACLSAKWPEATNAEKEAVVTLKMAADALEKGDFQVVLSLVDKVNNSSQSIGLENLAICIRGLALAGLGRFDEAINFVDQFIEEITANPNETTFTKSYLALVLLQANQPENALEIASQVLQVEPNEEFALMTRGKALSALNRHDEALADFTHVCDLNPNDAEAWEQRGRSLLWISQFVDADQAFQQAININPTDLRMYIHKTLALIGSEKTAEALQNLDLGLRQDIPTDHRITGLAVKIYLLGKEKKYEAARSVFLDLAKLAKQTNLLPKDFEYLIRDTALLGSPQFIREMIHETKSEETFPLLSRALDYLFTGDETIIEKLSPEVRNIVLEMVKKLRPAVQKEIPKPTKKARKAKSAPRSRTRKQLR